MNVTQMLVPRLRSLRISVAIALVACTPLSVMGADYQIEFDTLPGHTPGTGATLTSIVLSPFGWRSIGDPGGGRFVNRTGGVVKAIHLKTSDSTHRFVVTAASGGRLFDTVWAKDDGSEAYFMDANIPNITGVFWMRVPANTDVEIERCDTGQGCPFSGQAFPNNPADPTGPGWTRLRAAPDPPDDRWRALRQATPSEYRDIQAYGESSDGNLVVFVSKGQLLAFDQKERAVSLLPVLNTTLPPVNRISFDKGAFELWQSGKSLRKIPDRKSVV